MYEKEVQFFVSNNYQIASKIILKIIDSEIVLKIIDSEIILKIIDSEIGFKIIDSKIILQIIDSKIVSKIIDSENVYDTSIAKKKKKFLQVLFLHRVSSYRHRSKLLIIESL
jgi:hypothetical protein